MLFPQEPELAVGTCVWIAREGSGGGPPFVRGKVRAPPSDGTCEVAIEAEAQPVHCALTRLHLRSEPDAAKGEKPRLCDDNVALTHLNEPSLLENLRIRFEADSADRQLYTYTGHLLLVCNPFEPMPHLYSDTVKERYKGRPIGAAPPHTFALADRAYRLCVVDRADQAIVVIGESGAGKTETAKHILEYLAYMAQARAGTLVDVEQLALTIVHTTPVLEAFGNARTLRNNNSSRFGKFLKILFASGRGHILGADIQTYLLEKARVTAPSQGERTYHAFYQVLAAAEADLPAGCRADLGIDGASAAEFGLLEGTGCVSIVGKDDGAEYRKTDEAMDLLGISAELRQGCAQLIAGLLHLGNLTYSRGGSLSSNLAEAVAADPAEVIRSGDGVLSGESNARTLELAAEQFGCELGSLHFHLSRLQLVEVDKALSAAEGRTVRDSLMKELYHSLFAWLADSCRAAIAGDGAALRDGGGVNSIGVLDIYGFENFDGGRNGFEQLCINYANEKLLALFVACVFDEERKVYEAEGIPWLEEIVPPDNQLLLDLLEATPRTLSRRMSSGPLVVPSPGGGGAPLSVGTPRSAGGGACGLFVLLDDASKQRSAAGSSGAWEERASAFVNRLIEQAIRPLPPCACVCLTVFVDVSA